MLLAGMRSQVLVDITKQSRLTASSCKEGHSIESVLDKNPEIYWQ